MKIRSLSAALAAIGLVLTASSAAGAATSPGSAPTVTVNQESAGYSVHGGGYQFRYVETTFPVPSTAQATADVAIQPEMSFAVGLATMRQTIVLSVSPTGAGSIAQDYSDGTVGYSNTTAMFAPSTTGRLVVYYDQAAGTIQYTAYDNGSIAGSGSFPAWTPESAGGGPFSTAFARMDFSTDAYVPGAPINRPAADVRLVQDTSTGFTSYGGIHGTVSGPWGASQLVYGTSLNNVQVNAPVLFDGGAAFGVWARH